MLATVIICILLLAAAVFAVIHSGNRMKNGCCGGGADQVKVRKVSDRDKSHYPYCIQLTVDGMACGNCAKRVENALNGMAGVWAQVDLGARTAEVRMKTRIPEQQLCDCVAAAGYIVLHMNWS